MAKWSFNNATWLPVVVADTTSFPQTAGGAYMALQGGSATQVMTILEVYIGGQAGSSTPTYFVLSRDSTVGVTPAALTAGQKNTFLHFATVALAAPQTGFTSASTSPQRSSTLGLLNLSMNAFGGIVRWVAAPGEEIWMLGSGSTTGEISLSAYTGGTAGQVGSHIIYEPY